MCELFVKRVGSLLDAGAGCQFDDLCTNVLDRVTQHFMSQDDLGLGL